MPKNNTKNNIGTQIPYHVGVIPDGNRRWSKKSNLNLLRSYSIGIKKAVSCAVWAEELGVKVVTAWALSKENLKNRSKAELNVLFGLYTRAAYDKGIRRIADKNGIRINLVGELNLLPVKTRRALRDLASYTSKNSKILLNILVCYSGKDDILAAFKGGSAVRDKSEAGIRKRMISRRVPDLDLILRTSGEMRLSGFLPLQSTYAELYFIRKYWPEIEKSDINDALKEFAKRKRRFGK